MVAVEMTSQSQRRIYSWRRKSGFSHGPSSGSVLPPAKNITTSLLTSGVNEASTQGKTEIIIQEHPHIPEPMDHPEERTIRVPVRHHWLARLKRFMQNPRATFDPLSRRLVSSAKEIQRRSPWYKPSEEELYLLEEKKRRKKMARLLLQEANLYWDRLQNALDRMGYKYRPAKGESSGGYRFTRHVTFDKVLLQPEAIYYRIDSMRLPHGMSISDLMSDDPMSKKRLIDLSISCGRRITAEWSDRKGAWLIVERSIGVRGIPDHVKFVELLKAMPGSADGLTIPIGIGLNSKPIYRSLGRMYSMLIAGTIGGGKSNFINIVLVTLIKRNDPNRLKMILVDLKGGLEFQFYEGIPHLISIPEHAPNGIADRNQDVPGVLHWLHSEGERRMQVLREAGYKSIGRYNAYQQKGRMPHIVLCIDEWADVMYNKAIARDCEDTMANIAQRYRAVGIHVILCTQIPKAEVISTRIKGVLPMKMAFSVPTNPASMVIIDNGDAKGLQPTGRCIFQWDGQYEVQTPYINEELIDRFVQEVKTGEKGELDHKQHDVTQIEVMEWALAYENGYLSRDRVFGQFGKRGLTQDQVNQWLAEWQGNEFVIGTSLFRVVESVGNRPRRLIPIDEDADDRPDSPEAATATAPAASVAIEELLEYALIYQEGNLKQDKLRDAFRGRVTREQLNQILAACDGKQFQIGSDMYTVVPRSGKLPRKLQKIV